MADEAVAKCVRSGLVHLSRYGRDAEHNLLRVSSFPWEIWGDPEGALVCLHPSLIIPVMEGLY